MTPSHCIFKLIDSRLSCGVVELPEWFYLGKTAIGDPKFVEPKIRQEAFDKALANVIWFWEEKDVEEMHRWACTVYIYEFELMKPYKLPENLSVEIREEHPPLKADGLKVIYTGKNGYETDRQYANAHLKKGQVYTVAESIIESWSSSYVLMDVPNRSFNTVHFIVGKFAFLKQPKEQHLGFPIDGYRSHPQEKEESQNELWGEEVQGIKIEHLIWHGASELCKEKCHCHAECNKADEIVEEIKSKFTLQRK